MDYIVFDLEWNQPEGVSEEQKKILPFEIIEIGAVKLNSERNLVSKYNRLIKPQFYDRINRRIVKMLALKPGELDKGMNFEDAAGDFLRWCGKDVRFCTWGNQDLMELQRNMAYYGMEALSDRPLKYIDVQKQYSRLRSKGGQISLENAVTAENIIRDVPFHRAYSDAYYTSKILKIIPEDILESVYSYDLYHLPEEARGLKLDDKAGNIWYSPAYETKEDILNTPGIMTIRCPLCTKALKRRIGWFGNPGKVMHAAATCPEHGHVGVGLKIKNGEQGGVYAEIHSSVITKEEFASLKEKHRKSTAAAGRSES